MDSLKLDGFALQAEIHPSLGGIVSRLGWQAPDGRVHELLRPPPAPISTAAPNHGGSWAMLPFANRAFAGVVDDGTQRFLLPFNDASGTIHGFGWQSAWQVARYDRESVRLEHRRSEGADPYRYSAWQEIGLTETGMTVRFGVTSEADRALPFGIGHHPWFPRQDDTRLRLRAARALVFGEAFRALADRELSNGGPYADNPLFREEDVVAWNFIGWDGLARIETPSTGLAITLTASDSLACPVVWAPAGSDFLCVEPQSHASGAPSEAPARNAAPMKRLEPGESLEGWMTISPSLLQG